MEDNKYYGDLLVKLLTCENFWCESEEMHFEYYNTSYYSNNRKWEDRFICETGPIYMNINKEDLGETTFWANYDYCINGTSHVKLKLKDYKKTWWLKKDKSE